MELDRAKILYSMGVLLGVAAAFYFGFELLEDLSPATTSAVLFLGFSSFVFAGLYTETEHIDTVFYTLAAGVYAVFVAYTVSAFDLGDAGVFVVLAVSSALFIGLGYASNMGRLKVERRVAVAGVIAVLVVASAFIAFDVTGVQPTYEHDLEDEVETPENPRETVVLGSATVENPSILPRVADLPNLDGCLYTPERRDPAVVNYDDTHYADLLLSGGEARSFEITTRGNVFFDRDTGELYEPFAGGETVPIEVDDECPETVEEPKMVVVVTDG